ncbi:MAG: gliding motility-associated C-terminal domain-containing protein [Marinoscillum sp.]
MSSVKKILLLTGFLLLYGTGFGFHIVGGEIEFSTLDVGLYRINLIQYRDEAQTDNTFYEEAITLHIFSSKTDERVSIHTLRLATITEVPYSNQECAIEQLKTSRVLYTADVVLNPENYAHEEGYYIVWERCCRNVVIQNINNPDKAGMKYVLEIPPLWKDNAPFINSSPSLLRPLSDYACVDQLYYTDFTGTDVDGDSLSYRLAAPLNSSSQTEVPIPTPKPHIPVSWKSGYSVENMVPGSRPLRISEEGLLTVNPSQTGIYVFSVIVEEWRDGVQIGELQRDFQMLVVDGCNPPDPPVVGIKIPGDPDFNPEVDILSYELVDDKCFEFLVTNITPGETISLRAKGVNFSGYLEDFFTITQTPVGNQDTLLLEVCAPGCPPFRDRPFIVDLIAADDACPVPQLDTARLTIQVEPPPNVFPTTQSLEASYTINEGEVLQVVFEGVDVDDDSVELALFLPGVSDPGLLGFSLEILNQEAGETSALLTWDTNCQAYDFTDWQNFQLGIIPEDLDDCDYDNPNIHWVNMNVILPPNTSPIVGFDSNDSIHLKLGDKLEFDVFSNDADNDLINLKVVGVGFDATGTGAKFTEVEGLGAVESAFEWELKCGGTDINESGVYEFIFTSEDTDLCQLRNADSIKLKVYVEIPENRSPLFENYADVTIGISETYELDISAFDEDLDSVSVDFFNRARLPKSQQIEFQASKGYRQVTSTFSWTPDCSLLDFGETSAFYEIAFIAFDNGCSISKLDTMSIVFEVVETRDDFYEFQPPNVFTPNGDGYNDVYTLTNLSERRKNLPEDNCDDAFLSISIHSRSGTTVYESANREFVWDGRNVPVGVYYYTIKYTATEYKGYIQVLH